MSQASRPCISMSCWTETEKLYTHEIVLPDNLQFGSLHTEPVYKHTNQLNQ